MYTHVIFSLLLKAARASKEFYLSSLVISSSKECRQDRVSQSLNPTSYSRNGLAFSMEGCTLCVVCWVVTISSQLHQCLLDKVIHIQYQLGKILSKW